MKVLHVYRTYFPDPPGGLQEAIRQICLSTQPFGVENTIFTLSPNPQPAIVDRSEARVVRCRSWAAPASCDLGGVGALLKFRELAAEADVVHYLFPWPYGDLLRCIAPRKPSVLTYISDIVRQKWLGAAYAPLMWRTLKSMDAIVSNAPGYAKSSPVLTNKILSDRIHQIPLGIEEDSQKSAPDEGVFSRLHLEAEDSFGLFVGVLRYYKGLHVLMRAAETYNGKLVIAGSGPQQTLLKQEAKRAGLDNVIFAGQVTEAEKTALLRHCKFLVLPSHLRSEAYGMVLVEASMYGKPMVSCEIGTGTSFINQDGETGFVVEPESPQSLSDAMNILMVDDILVEQFGKAARARYDKYFAGPRMGRAYTDLYDWVIQKEQLPRNL